MKNYHTHLGGGIGITQTATTVLDILSAFRCYYHVSYIPGLGVVTDYSFFHTLVQSVLYLSAVQVSLLDLAFEIRIKGCEDRDTTTYGLSSCSVLSSLFVLFTFFVNRLEQQAKLVLYYKCLIEEK